MSFLSETEITSTDESASSNSTFSYKREYENHVEYLANIIDKNSYVKIFAEHLNSMGKNNIMENASEESYIDEDDEEEDIQINNEENTENQLLNMEELNKPFRKIIRSLKHIPRLEDLSEILLISTKEDKIQTKNEVAEEGDEEREEENEVEIEYEEEEDVEKDGEEEEEEWPSFGSSSSDIFLKTSMDEMDECFEDFLTALTQKQVKLDSSNSSDMEKNERIELIKFLNCLLNDVLNAVVEFCAERSAIMKIKKKLDKKKISKEIASQFKNLLIELPLLSTIHRKVVEYYRRKKVMKPLINTPVENDENALNRLRNAYHNLNILMGKEKYAENIFKKENDRLNDAILAMRTQVDNEINAFEELVSQSLCREHFKYLPTSIQVKLKRITEFRNEISADRQKLILQQHIMSVLIKRSDKRECIGKNLKLKDYIDLETEVKNLDDKLSERTEEVGKLQYRFCNETNIFSHLKCSKNLIQEKVDSQTKLLYQYYRAFKTQRSKLNILERKRTEIRKERTEISDKCGIIAKTRLMYDYDELILAIEAKQENINELKNKYYKILHSIENLESKSCGT